MSYVTESELRLLFRSENNGEKYMKKLIIIVLMLLPIISCAQSRIKLVWDANTETDLAGYKIYWGTETRVYSNVVDVGNVTIYFPDLEYDIRYYFAATAYDTAGNESGYSNEVSGILASPDITAPDAPLLAIEIINNEGTLQLAIRKIDNKFNYAILSNMSTFYFDGKYKILESAFAGGIKWLMQNNFQPGLYLSPSLTSKLTSLSILFHAEIYKKLGIGCGYIFWKENAGMVKPIKNNLFFTLGITLLDK